MEIAGMITPMDVEPCAQLPVIYWESGSEPIEWGNSDDAAVEFDSDGDNDGEEYDDDDDDNDEEEEGEWETETISAHPSFGGEALAVSSTAAAIAMKSESSPNFGSRPSPRPDLLQHAMTCSSAELDALIEEFVLPAIRGWRRRENVAVAEAHIRRLVAVAADAPSGPEAVQHKRALVALAVLYMQKMRRAVEEGGAATAATTEHDPNGRRFAPVPGDAVRCFATACKAIMDQYELGMVEIPEFVDTIACISNAGSSGLGIYVQ